MSKQIEVNVRHDRLREGLFPVEELKELGVICTQKENKNSLSGFKQIWNLVIPINDEDNELEVVYDLGKLIQSHIMTRHL